MGLIANRSDVTWTPIRNNDISWNFQKWLIKHDGQPFRRYTSRTTPQAIEEDIKQLLNECSNNTEETKQNETLKLQQPQQPPQLMNITHRSKTEKPAKKHSFFRWLF